MAARDGQRGLNVSEVLAANVNLRAAPWRRHEVWDHPVTEQQPQSLALVRAHGANSNNGERQNVHCGDL
jgi:hypothetical protein